MSSDRAPAHDIIILGSGLAGSMLGAILARRGADVLILDSRSHPRPASGESVSPRAAVALRALSIRYDVPEIKVLTTYENASRIINSSFGVRRHFGFLLHEDGQRQNPGRLNQASNGPLDDPPHLFRQDSDSYLFTAAIQYGCTARQNYRVASVETDGAGVTVHGVDGSTHQARYLVDTTGRDAPTAKAFGLREETPRFRHHSRVLTTHLLDVKSTDAIHAGRRPADVPPIPWDQGTVYNLFEGGFLGVVPFGNHPRSRNRRTSVTLSLDPRRHPAEDSPAEAFTALTHRFPDLARQFEDALLVREWEATERAQYGSTQVVGDRWCMIADSAGFVDPLFARDLSNNAEVINALAWRLLLAFKDDDFSADRFDHVGRLQQGLLDYDDQLVDSAYSSFGSYPLWNAVFRIWAWGSGAGTFRLQESMARFLQDGRDAHFRELEDVPYPGFLWPDHDGFKKLFDEMVTHCRSSAEGLTHPDDAARDLITAISSADFFPRHLGFAEPQNRFVHATPKAIVKSLRWAVKDADPELKRLLIGNMKHVVGSKIGAKLGRK
ncbi:MAG: FAD-dependent monooxygenase [Streptosporangiaceae bacterium]